jgi:hypothetical protein
MQYVDAQSLTCGVPKSIPFYPIPYRLNRNTSLAMPVEGKIAPAGKAISRLGLLESPLGPPYHGSLAEGWKHCA